MPGQQPGMDGSAVLLLHRVSGTFPTLTTAGCCPSAAGCRATVCGASRRTTPATSGYWAGPPTGEWSGQAERMRFARLIHRPVRVLGGPAVRAASGGDPSLSWLPLRVVRYERHAAAQRGAEG